MSARIVLTADHTLMSDYRQNEFLGFGTCAPPNFIPNSLYRWLFFPPTKTREGMPIVAPYGLRKIEAQLVNEGFNVVTAAPNHLKDHIRGAKALGIHVMDPFGLGPASSTFAFVLKKEPFLAQYFRALLACQELRKAKKAGLKILVGGPGVWQFKYRQGFVKRYGIDCIISGEAEKVIGNVVRAVINGEDLPMYYDVAVKDTPELGEIPNIVKPSVNGLVEIGRGCCRGCQFCSVTLRPLRWFPLEKIMAEIDVNTKACKDTWICLHAEDVMLYGSKNTSPDDEKLLKLHESVTKSCKGIAWSHCSLAAVAAKPKLFSAVAETIHQRQPWWGVEIGIETGSPRLAKKVMPAKAHPFKADDWPEVVRSGMGLMHDHKLIPAATLIVGSPEETEDDLVKTIELVDDLRDVRSLIVPLFFVPMGRLKDEQWFEDAQMTELHKELLIRCMQHGFRWVDDLIGLAFAEGWKGKVMAPFYRIFKWLAEYKVKQAGIAPG